MPWRRGTELVATSISYRKYIQISIVATTSSHRNQAMNKTFIGALNEMGVEHIFNFRTRKNCISNILPANRLLVITKQQTISVVMAHDIVVVVQPAI